MPSPDKSKIDLNSLKVLEVLYQCGSTVKAAEQLGISQSRVSQLLGQLRETLNDPLFIRAQGRLQPTERATALSQCLSRVLPEIYAHCFDAKSFEPEKYEGRINVFISGILIDVLGASTLSLLAKLMPKASIFLKQWSSSTIDAFDTDEINIGINHYPLNIGKNIRQIPVVKERAIVTMREGNPKARANISVEELFGDRLAGAIIPELTEHQSLIESALKELNISFAVRSDNRSALFRIIQDSDFVLVGMTIPNSLRPPGLICFSPACLADTNIDPLSVAIYYRQSLAQDPRIQFLEQQLKSVIKDAWQHAIDSLDQPK